MLPATMKKNRNQKNTHNFSKGKRDKSFQFAEVKLLIVLKSTLEGLPTNKEYRIENELQYNRKMAKALSLLSSVRLEQIPYVVSTQTFKKIITQLTRQTSNKQISICLLKQFSKGFLEYTQPLSTTLYDVLYFMIEMDGLQKKQVSSQITEKDSQTLEVYVLSKAIFELIKSIIRWYRLTSEGKEISKKYESLIECWKSEFN